MFQSQIVHAFWWKKKKKTLKKLKWNEKWKIQHTLLERQTMCRLYKNRKSKEKLLWVVARERKKRAFFIPFILSKGNFCILSPCIVYWILQNIYTFTYQKQYSLLVFEITESLQCILNAALEIRKRKQF